MSDAFEVGAGGGEVGAGGGEVGAGVSGGGTPVWTAAVTGAGSLTNTVTATHKTTAAVAGAGSLTNTATGALTVVIVTAKVTGAGSLRNTLVTAHKTTAAIGAAGSLRNTATAGAATLVSANIIQPPATFSGQQTRPPVGSEAFPMAGAPSYPLTLFRGAVIDVAADRDDGLLRLVLDCEDYNRQPPMIDVGVPIPGNIMVEPVTGNEIEVDPDAMNNRGVDTGNGPGEGWIVAHFYQHYWPIMPYTSPYTGSGFDYSRVLNTNPDYSGLPIYDRQTAYSDFASVVGEFIRQRGSGASRTWVMPEGDELIPHYRVVGLFDGLPDQRVPAPWALSTEGKPGTIMANISADWDARRLRRRVLVMGGTPNAVVYRVNEAAPTNAGDGRVSAPGITTRAEAERVGDFHLLNNMREFLIAQVHIPPGHLEGATYVPNDGWAEGQSVLLSDEKMDGLVDRELVDREAIIHSFRWNQVTSAPGTGIRIDIEDLSDLVVAWERLSGERRLAGPGKATIVVYLWDPDARISVRKLADVKIWIDGNSDIEYDLEAGDVEAGDLAIQFRDNTRPPYTKPVYTFNIFVTDRKLLAGDSTPVIITPALPDYEPRDLAGLTIIPLLFAWADAAKTEPSDEYTLDDDGNELVTNTVGQVYTTLRRAASSATGTSSWEILCVAVPKVEPA